MECNTDRLLTKADVKRRGWSDAMIAHFLGVPDQERPNPKHRSGATVKLFCFSRVEKAEAMPEFQEVQAKRKTRSDAAKRAAALRRQQTEEYVDAIEIRVEILDKEELIARAYKNYYASKVGSDFQADPGDTPEFIERICVNYLRHCLTRYEDHLRHVAGRVGVSEAYLEIKSKVLDEIGDSYPWLIGECIRQERRMLEQGYA